MSTDKTTKNDKKYHCDICDFYTRKKTDFLRHHETIKHKNNLLSTTDDNEKAPKNEKVIECDTCGKTYSERSGLWRHKKKCKGTQCEEDGSPIQNTSNQQITPELVMALVQQNKEMQNIVMEVVKNGTTAYSHNTNTNTNSNHTNSHNKTFNLQFFLNETCKNAMSIEEFVNDIVLTLGDLEETGRIGFAEGISKIINRRLKALAVTERPIHCSDSKRETLYVKDKDKWEKEDETHPILTKTVKNIAGKNMMQIFDWQKAHPDYSDPDTRTSDRYMKMLTNVMSGGTEEETNNNYDKIVRNIIKEVSIDKERFSTHL